jgi:SAM-dependent methyltransferase
MGMIDELNYKFIIDEESEILLNMPQGVFSPTGTTTLLLKAIRSHIRNPGSLLDLGCGSGVLGIALYKLGLAKAPLYASDLSRQAIDCVIKNALNYDYPIEAKCGSLFKSWENYKFDYIVNDVSGVAIEIAKVSPWFKEVPCDSGIDGVALAIKVLRQARDYLNKNGTIFFPVISLSNVDKILSTARENFTNVMQLAHQEWPLPKEMNAHIPLLTRLQEQGHIQIKEKFGMMLWFTDIYAANNLDRGDKWQK